MIRLLLVRTLSDNKQTLGNLYLIVNDQVELILKSLELPWRDNNVRVSCIPDGTYKVIQHTSPKFGWCLWLQDVPGRSEILIHQGNYTRQIHGCILPGILHTDTDLDGIIDVKHSMVAMEALRQNIGASNDITIEIRS